MKSAKGPGKELNDQERLFIDQYLIDRNATQAAIRAGYSPKGANVQGCRMLKRPAIRDAVDKALAEIAAAAHVDAEYVLITLKETVERCLQHKPVMVFDSSERAMVQATAMITDKDGNEKEVGIY